ncbi:hypothetical protein [Streptomyces sp. UG1]|uniref:hypothetical protein n=1 Tax=Streptomyces sp. UG1 TaxID=3417652 RepID=UPI003CF0EF3F
MPAAPRPLASFVRFVLYGGGVGVVSSAAVRLVAEVLPWAVANALITVVSTLLGTELHALFTFRTGRRAGWRRHLQSAGSATAAYAVTTAAVLILDAVNPSAGLLWQQVVYLGAAGLAGVGRFLVLRLVVFAEGRDRTAVRVAKSPTSLGRWERSDQRRHWLPDRAPEAGEPGMQPWRCVSFPPSRARRRGTPSIPPRARTTTVRPRNHAGPSPATV